MALRKTLAERLFRIGKASSPIPAPLSRSQTPITASLFQKLFRSRPHEERRFLHHNVRAIRPELFALPIGEKLIEKVKGLNGDRIHFDVLAPTVDREADGAVTAVGSGAAISVEEVKKVLRISQVEAVKETLRGVSENSISYSEYVRICCESSGVKQGLDLARALDESGNVIVLGKVVFIRPEQVAKAIENVIPQSPAEEDPRREDSEELRELWEKKVEIDRKAVALVRRELWCGLAFLVVQTAGFMRLTFWELSWDVMEPICFYVTSVYFMLGYAFFLRTSRDPSFEGFFESRFASKQKRLMRHADFDVERFNELCKATCSSSKPWEYALSSSS